MCIPKVKFTGILTIVIFAIHYALCLDEFKSHSRSLLQAVLLFSPTVFQASRMNFGDVSLHPLIKDIMRNNSPVRAYDLRGSRLALFYPTISLKRL